MLNYFGTDTFWITIALVPLIYLVIMCLGFWIIKIFPKEVKGELATYLAPVIGLAIFVILSSYIGRFFPLGDPTVRLIFLVAIIVLVVMTIMKGGKDFFDNYLRISLFGLICGTTLLVPIFLNGAYDVHNDTFTYLVHSEWLQLHAFSETILQSAVTPATTQVYVYQQEGLRMGGSYLLALVQSLSGLDRAFNVYPALAIVALGSSCLPLGVIISKVSKSLNRWLILAIVALPALSLGGLVFAANYGFLPQAVGISIGFGLLVFVGWFLDSLKRDKPDNLLILKTAFICAIMFSGIVFAYSEMLPFFLLSLIVSCLFIAIRKHLFPKIAIFGSLFALLSLVILNAEFLRAFKALKTQSVAVVGAPVDWSLADFLAHAIGLKTGIFDNPLLLGSFSPILAGAMMVILTIVLILQRKKICISINGSLILPIISILTIFILTFIYFRYLVDSPFLVGKGQSWSQFKITDWSNIFLVGMLLLPFVILGKELKSKIFSTVVVVMLLFSLFYTIISSEKRMDHVVAYYGNTRDLSSFYLDLRETVDANCVDRRLIYLDLGGENHKARQMASLYLSDKRLVSNWKDDNYISPHLPSDRLSEPPISSECMVTTDVKKLEKEKVKKIGPFYVGISR